MTRPDYLHLVLVIDRSGSMASIRNDMIGGVNALIDEQLALSNAGEMTVTVVTFDAPSAADWYTRVRSFAPLSAASKLTTDDLVPRGATALIDAACMTIDTEGQALAAMPEDQRPSKVLVVLVTDGEENASRDHTKADLQQRIKTQSEAFNWQFAFMGTTEAGIAEARMWGIAEGATVMYAANAAGTRGMTATLSAMTTTARTSS